jgi:hypothetical protein
MDDTRQKETYKFMDVPQFSLTPHPLISPSSLGWKWPNFLWMTPQRNLFLGNTDLQAFP